MRIASRILIGLVLLTAVVVELGDTAGMWAVNPAYTSGSCVLQIAGRDYLSPTQCGPGGKNLCWSPRYLRSIEDWPPGRRVLLVSLRGWSTVYVPRAPSGADPTFVLVARGGCFVPYALSGGP
jgi:hypothetical protein